jgi:hypothetical protein
MPEVSDDIYIELSFEEKWEDKYDQIKEELLKRESHKSKESMQLEAI